MIFYLISRKGFRKENEILSCEPNAYSYFLQGRSKDSFIFLGHGKVGLIYLVRCDLAFVDIEFAMLLWRNPTNARFLKFYFNCPCVFSVAVIKNFQRDTAKSRELNLPQSDEGWRDVGMKK